MSYVVLARKWRPMRFSDLVGQDHVARTLGNAITSGRVAHAFLFTGVRGVGKTTSARILAKALNCMGAPGTVEPGVDPGPTTEPCLECSACKEIALGTDVDVREIDGASYNGVDEVRRLQESLPYRPTRDRFKIVIVDEVHMLTNAAWNAFLKTLEEPPAHVKFIFATTEVHKVPVTILSRVQRFDFKMIPVRTIADRLRYVLTEEKIEADEEALSLLARQAAGSMRDGMSLLDQVIAFGGTKLVGEEVAQVLGVASRSAVVDVARALVNAEPEECLRLIGQVADQGFNISHIARDLLSFIRDLVVAKICPTPGNLLDLSDEEQAQVSDLAGSASEIDLLRLHQGFSRGYDDVARGADPRASLEMLLVRLSLRPPLLPVDELLHRIAGLEKRLASGGAISPRRPGGGGSSGGSVGTGPGRQESPRHAGSREHSRGASAPEASAAPDDDPAPAPRAAEPTPAPEPRAPEPRAAEPRAAEPRAAEPRAADQRAADQRAPAPQRTAEQRAPAPSPAPAAATSAPVSAPPSVQPSGAANSSASSTSTAPPQKRIEMPKVSAEDRERLEALAPLAASLTEVDALLGAYVEQCVPFVADGKLLELGLEPGFLFEKELTNPESRKKLETILKAAWGDAAELRFTTSKEAASPERTLSAKRAFERQARRDAAIETVKNHPAVQLAVEILDARIKDVRIPEASPA